MRRTKIVCTLGPASHTPEIIESLIRAGMDVARLNFSHGSHEQHRCAAETVRSRATAVGRNVAILIDLQGPKIRTGELVDHRPVPLRDGAELVITTQDVIGTPQRISTSYANLPTDVQPGNRILLADGLLELQVRRVTPPDVHCVVVHGGMLGELKGINLPGVRVTAPSLTNKDLDDLAFGLDLNVDFVGLSYVRSPDDVRSLKERIKAAGKSAKVVAKIERPEALDCFDNILREADAIMVARGDLGVEVELARVPQIQKSLIHACNKRGIPVITATQMLESMMNNPRPTRAEVTDVANAVYDGSDAVMLSGETATGAFPIDAVHTMENIVREADEAFAAAPSDVQLARLRAEDSDTHPFRDAIGQAVVRASELAGLKHIVVFTQSGFSAESVARCRPSIPITAFTLTEQTRRRCALIWGVDAIASVEVKSLMDMLRVVDDVLLGRGVAKSGDAVAIVAGTPLGIGGRTNLFLLHRAGETSGQAP